MSAYYGGRRPGARNRKAILSGKSLALLAGRYTEEAVKQIHAIARGECKAMVYLPEKKKNGKKNGKKHNGEGTGGHAVPHEPTGPYFIPFNVRLAAWNILLDRAHGKPFQSVQIFNEEDITISFKNAEHLRTQLIDAGVPAALLPPPRLKVVDAEVVLSEAEEEARGYRKRG